jgi:uncharacterized protein YutE (UPF0331/DUF86 family)
MPVVIDIPSRLQRLTRDCQRLESYREFSLEEFLANLSAQDDTAYLLCTTYQSALDIAAGLLSRLSPPRPAAQVNPFALLAEGEVLSDGCVAQLNAMQGLCNALSQQYGEIDPQWIYQTLQVNLAGLNQFGEQVQAFLER